MTTSLNPSAAPTFGSPPSSYQQSWQSAFLAQLTRRLGLLSGPYTIQPQLLLQSPNGTIWQVTVSDAGLITATVAPRGAIHPPV